MNEDLKTKILKMAELAKPSDEQKSTLIQEWDDYFRLVRVRHEEQEFDAIMTSRIVAGGISLRAPVFPMKKEIDEQPIP